MNGQMTFGDMEYTGRKRVGRRETFLQTMDKVVPWDVLIPLIQPHYYPGTRGRPPRGIEVMLRMYLHQVWFNMADEALEETIYDSYAMKRFMKLDFFREDVPDATTLLQFRHLLEQHNLQEQLFKKINELLEEKGVIMQGGTIIDATIIEAPCSTKNSAKSRDGEMKQAKKGNEWHFGMKGHIGVDAGSGMIHSVEVSAANENDITMAHKLIRKDDEVVYGDNGYQGIEKREEIKKSEQLSKVEYRINTRKGAKRKQEKELYKHVLEHLEYIAEPQWEKEIEYLKSKVRSKVEHAFYIIKGIFGYRKTRYRGLKKNHGRLYMLCGSANLLRWIWAGCPEWAAA